MLKREEILSLSDLKKEKVSVPEWGGDVFVSEMTGEARDAWEVSLDPANKGQVLNARAKLVAATVVDEGGKRVFTDAQDVQALGNLSSSALDKICRIAQKLNGLSSQELKAAEGNS